MKTPILGSTYVARSVNAAANRMVNLFPEMVPEGGKEPAYLQRAPGLRLLGIVGSGPIRGLWTYGGYGYVVSGTELYQIDSAYNATLLGNVSGTGPVSMSDNGTQLFIACNPLWYIYNSNTNVFQQLTGDTFPGAVTVGYIDGYFVFNEPNSQKVWVTALLDGYDPGMRRSRIDPIFADLAAFLPGFIAEARDKHTQRGAAQRPKGPFPIATQKALAEKLMARDFNRDGLPDIFPSHETRKFS